MCFWTESLSVFWDVRHFRENADYWVLETYSSLNLKWNWRHVRRVSIWSFTEEHHQKYTIRSSVSTRCRHENPYTFSMLLGMMRWWQETIQCHIYVDLSWSWRVMWIWRPLSVPQNSTSLLSSQHAHTNQNFGSARVGSTKWWPSPCGSSNTSIGKQRAMLWNPC